VFQTSLEAQALMGEAMKEVIDLAGAARVNLREEDIEEWYGVMKGLAPHGRTSMLQDIDAGRKTEIEMLGGKVIEMGRQYDIPTPVNRALVTLIKVIEARAMCGSDPSPAPPSCPGPGFGKAMAPQNPPRSPF
jgi:2-dehydropantoate 2-reductase